MMIMTEPNVKEADQPSTKIATLRILKNGQPVSSKDSFLLLEDTCSETDDWTVRDSLVDLDLEKGEEQEDLNSNDNKENGDGESDKNRPNPIDGESSLIFDPLKSLIPNSTIFIYNQNINPKLKESLLIFENHSSNPKGDELSTESPSSLIKVESTLTSSVANTNGNKSTSEKAIKKTAGNINSNKRLNFIKLNKTQLSTNRLKTSSQQQQQQHHHQPHKTTPMKILSATGFDWIPSYMSPTTCVQIRNHESFLERCEKKGLTPQERGRKRNYEDSWSEIICKNKIDMNSYQFSGKSPPHNQLVSRGKMNSNPNVSVPLHVSCRMKAQFALEKQLKNVRKANTENNNNYTTDIIADEKKEDILTMTIKKMDDSLKTSQVSNDRSTKSSNPFPRINSSLL